MDIIEKKLVVIICIFLIDVIEKVNFGYSGMLMGVVLMVYMLWIKFMNVSLVNSGWFNCDCFVLFVGYGLVFLYSMFYLSGFDFSIEDFKGFCQWGSKISGYLEFGYIVGVDVIIGLFG